MPCKCDPALLVGLSKEERVKVLRRERQRRHRQQGNTWNDRHKEERKACWRASYWRNLENERARKRTPEYREINRKCKRGVRARKNATRTFLRLTQAAAMLTECQP